MPVCFIILNHTLLVELKNWSAVACTCLQKQGIKRLWSLLEQKFGHKHKIAMAHVEQLTKGNPIKPEDADLLEQFSSAGTSASNTLKAIGYLHKIENPDTMKKIFERKRSYDRRYF